METQTAQEVAPAQPIRAKLGDIVVFDYVLSVDGRTIESTIVDAAKAGGIWSERKQYRPMSVLLGTGSVIVGVEEQLLERATLGQGFTIAVPAARAFGERDPAKIRDIPAAKLNLGKGEKPKVGMTITGGNGERGVVVRAFGGRVRVDFNHSLAGKTLEYYVKVVDILTDPQMKAHLILGKVSEHMRPSFEGDCMVIQVSKSLFFDQGWQAMKARLVNDLRIATDNKFGIRFVEDFPIGDFQPNMLPSAPTGATA